MVLTTPELLSALQQEVRILLHLAGKFNHDSLAYRPTPRQRSSLELLQYLTMMGPVLAEAIAAGAFDADAWAEAEAAAESLNLEQALASIATQSTLYARLLDGFTDDAWRAPVEMFGTTASRGAHMVNLVLCGYAAYRTQLFLYLKSCGQEELGTYNLWAGMDAPAAA
jgi:hypothetical protein